MRATTILGWAFLFIAPIVTLADDAPPCQIHVILFVPSDVAPPLGYERRMDQIVNYTESFLRRGLERWGHRDIAMPFRRSADGRTEVTVIRGKEGAAHYKPVTVRVEVMDEMRRRGKLDGGRQIWWIMVYVGDPPAKFSTFLGGFGPQIGGWSVCNFNTAPGRIDPSAPLGSDFLESIMLKGMIHELGHAFQLPHVGPLNRDRSGNTLMGPTHYNFRRVVSTGEQRVYLSEAEAAMLSTHPAFRGVPDDGGQLPKVEVQDMKYSVNFRSRSIVVTGRVRASRRAVYALVADESDARPGEYWTKTYVGKVAPDGAFGVIVSEPSASNGTLKTWFAFEDGALTGDGRRRGREGGIPRAYIYTRNGWAFK